MLWEFSGDCLPIPGGHIPPAAAEVEAASLARAKGFEAQVGALGPNATALVNVVNALAEGRAKFVPEILVTSGNGSGAFEGLAAAAMRFFGNGKPQPKPQEKATEEAAPNPRSSST